MSTDPGGRLSAALRGTARFLARVPRYIVLVPVFAYRWLVSPMLPDTCIYTPSCSHYTVDSILRHGALKGLALGTARVLRCSGGLFEGGYDPVPEQFSFAEIQAGYRRHRRGRGGDERPAGEGRDDGSGGTGEGPG
jgi:hypothetical protein